jgi:hypothetical protein
VHGIFPAWYVVHFVYQSTARLATAYDHFRLLMGLLCKLNAILIGKALKWQNNAFETLKYL